MKLKARGDIARAQAHATRSSKTGAEHRRDDLLDSHPVALAWCMADGDEWHLPTPTLLPNSAKKNDREHPPEKKPKNTPSPGLNIVQSFDDWLDENDYPEPWGSGPVAWHLLAILPPLWLAQGGDPRDPNNPLVRAFFREAHAWAQHEIGGVFAARYDLDEAGSGVVDLFAAPVQTFRGKPRLMPVRASKQMAQRVRVPGGKTPMTYAAFQTSWANWAQEHLDPLLQRGRPKKETQAEHVHAVRFKAEAEAMKKREAAIGQRERAVHAAEREVIRNLRRFALLNARALQAICARLETPQNRVTQLEERLAAAAERMTQDPYDAGFQAGARATEETWIQWQDSLPEQLRAIVCENIVRYKKQLAEAEAWQEAHADQDESASVVFPS